jgi:hypothetical protein
MSLTDSHDEEQRRTQGDPPPPPHKPRSTKQFLMFTATRFSLGLGLIGLIGLGAWLTRESLATMTIESFLRSKGIAAEIDVKKLQLGTAQIHNLRLGPVDKPSLEASTGTITWHYDSAARLFVIDQLVIDGLTARLAVDKQGKLDFGALAPLLKPSTGPKRSVINGVSLSNATVILETPLGPARSTLALRGGESTGWTGYGDIIPPTALLVSTNDGRQTFAPLRVGFAAYPSAKMTNLGFAILPKGQSLTYQGLTFWGLTGALSGSLVVADDKRITITTRPSNLRIDRFESPSAQVSDLDLKLAPLAWSHKDQWQTTGEGSGAVSGSLSVLRVAGSALGPSQFRINGARTENGAILADVDIDATGVSGALTAQRLALKSRISTTLVDVTQLASADINAQTTLRATNLRVPPALIAGQSSTLPPAFLDILKGSTSGQGSFNLVWGPKGGRIGLLGPLNLTSSSGANLSWTRTGNQTPSLILAKNADGDFIMSALGTGRVQALLPNMGTLTGSIEAATFGPSGWAFIGRDISGLGAQALTRPFGFDANMRLDRIALSQSPRESISGQGTGTLDLSGSGSRARLRFDGRATKSAVTGTLQDQ